MGTKIKICGLTRKKDIEYVNNFLPDLIGFVFAKSRRQVTKEQAKQLGELLDERIIKVGVFVNQPVQYVADLVNENIIDYVQLHGDEDNEYIGQLTKLVDAKINKKDIQKKEEQLPETSKQFKIIKAIRVKSKEDIAQANGYQSDYVLFDSFSLECEGGTGKKFDWSFVQKVEKPFFLAGGIDIQNVREAIQYVNPYGVDASSSLETDGLKDKDKIKQYIELIRQL